MIEVDDIGDLPTAREVIRQMQRALKALQDEVTDLKGKLEESRRAGKRQAAPFSKGEPKEDPKKPGQKSGHVAARRETPAKIDRVLAAELWPMCDCGGVIKKTDTKQQYVADIPRQIPVTVTQFDIEIGCCESCGKRHQGRHLDQISDALGAASVQIGPNILALGTELKHKYGMAYGQLTGFLTSICGIKITRSAFTRADQRIARRLKPTYDQLVLRLRESGLVHADETGWRVNGRPAWLWVFANAEISVYVIDRTRAHDVIETILERDFKGVLKSDCFLAYDSKDLKGIEHSKCLGHLIRRSRELEQEKTGRRVMFPRKVTAILRKALELKTRRETMSAHGYVIARGRLEQALDRLLAGNYLDKDNAKLARLLRRHRDQLFNFLAHPEVDGTNNLAEREIRPSVIIRKTNGCNRSTRGAKAHQVIASILRTCAKQRQNFGACMTKLMRLRLPTIMDFLAPAPTLSNTC